MANMNTFAQIVNLTANSTATETAVAAVAGGTTRAIVGLENDVAGGLFDGQPFKLRVVCQGIASGAGNFAVNVYWNSGGNTNLTTFTNDILVQGSGNQALASKSGIVYMEEILMWDATLQQLSGIVVPLGFSSLVTTPNLLPSGAAPAKINTSGVVATAQTNASAIQFFVTTSISANGTSAKLLELALDQI